MLTLENNLALGRCPHCSIATPYLRLENQLGTTDHKSENHRSWRIYSCAACGGVVTASAHGVGMSVTDYFPKSRTVSEDIPDRPRDYLQQALGSLNAPAGAVMLAASSVDSMLKVKGLTEGSLYSRIEKAVESHLITSDMSEWAHDVRLDANDQRHADDSAALPSMEDASRAIEFATALGEILFVLPSRVQRGMNRTNDD